MNKIFLSVFLFLMSSTISFSQSVGIGTTTPDASAVLELKATNKGFLPPRMTAAEKVLVPSPKAGLIIYQTDGAAGLYVYNGSAWAPVAGSGSPSGGWSLGGNSGTVPGTNYVGTNDNQPLLFKVNSIQSGEINPVNANVSFGPFSLVYNSSGSQNSAFGYNTLMSNTTGSDNAAVGIGALYFNTTGKENTAIGKTSLVQNVSGNGNVAVGAEASYKNVSGLSNIAIGIGASHENVDGSNSVAVGDSALYLNTMGNNTAVGSKALFGNTTGVSNTALGNQSLFNNKTGSQNTAVGRIALYANTTGIQNTGIGNQALRYNQSGNANTALGFQSLFNNVANNNNTAIGNGSLANTVSDNNTAVGHSTLKENVSGISNTAVGMEALSNNITGSYNTAIGYKAAVWGNNYVNATAVGANAQSACSNCVVLGSVDGYNGATANSRVGVGVTSPQKTLHVNPNGAGGISIGQDLVVGGYTALNMGITQLSGGNSFIQSVRSTAASPTYGSLLLNQNGGNVGVRTSVALAALHIKQYEDKYPTQDAGLRFERHDNISHWDLGIDYVDDMNFSFNGAAKLYFRATDGSMYTVSDERMKRDVSLIGTTLPSLMKLQAKTYHYIDNEKNATLSYGFIAQEVEKIFPDFVMSKGVDQSKAVSYQKINVMAVKAIQEQQLMIEKQQTQIETLQQQNVLMIESLKRLEKVVEDLKGRKQE